MKHGDFSKLAANYDQYRPRYSEEVLTQIISRLSKPISSSIAADVGAGTGIWSRMLFNRGFKKVFSIEPNDVMRKYGMRHKKFPIEWKKGSGENTTLTDKSCDLVSMASSFHWINFNAGIKEFHRILAENGLFVALWNPRYLDNSPLLIQIEEKLSHLKGENLKRVSSGASQKIDKLMEDLDCSIMFKGVEYFEGTHTQEFSIEAYLGVWNSVNDVRVQLGERKFLEFMTFVKQQIQGQDSILAEYKTKAFLVQKA